MSIFLCVILVSTRCKWMSTFLDLPVTRWWQLANPYLSALNFKRNPRTLYSVTIALGQSCRMSVSERFISMNILRFVLILSATIHFLTVKHFYDVSPNSLGYKNSSGSRVQSQTRVTIVQLESFSCTDRVQPYSNTCTHTITSVRYYF